MSYASLILPCLALRSTDTMETLAKAHQRYRSIASEAPELANIIHTCVNLQKKETGLSGIMYEIQGDSLLNSTDMLTEEVFKGISVVKCDIDEIQAISLMQKKEELTDKLHTFLSTMQKTRQAKAGMLLDQILPSAEGQDFWWYGQTCELKGGVSIRDCILHDGKRGDVSFYDAFSCINRSATSLVGDDTGFDLSFKDACIWDPVLHGSIGLYTQRAGDGNNVFLVCVSDFDQIASDIVRSMKADLGNAVSAYDFCNSKEMWFIEKIALRNRLRLLLLTAQHLGIPVPQKHDLYAHPKQANSDLAVECCGVNLDHIECVLQQHALTHRSTPVVRHYKDCIDIYHRNGPVPVFLGDDMGFMLLLSDKFSHASFSLYNDPLPFVQNKSSQQIQLCPTHNIFEQNYASVQKIRSEHQNIIHVKIEDFLYDMQQQGIHVLPSVHDLLTATDDLGNCLFYGVQHGVGTPMVVYPRVSPPFLTKKTLARHTPEATHLPPPHDADATEPTPSELPVGSPNQSSHNVHHTATLDTNDNQAHVCEALIVAPKPTTGVAKHKNMDLCEVMCENFVYEVAADGAPSRLFDFQVHVGASNPDSMQLEWGELTMSLLQRMTRMQHIETLQLLPYVTFSNSVEN